MKKKTVIKHFKGSPRAVAEAIDVTTQYVSQWPELVPEAMAGRLDKLTNGRLKYNPQTYIEASRKKRTQ